MIPCSRTVPETRAITAGRGYTGTILRLSLADCTSPPTCTGLLGGFGVVGTGLSTRVTAPARWLGENVAARFGMILGVAGPSHPNPGSSRITVADVSRLLIRAGDWTSSAGVRLRRDGR